MNDENIIKLLLDVQTNNNNTTILHRIKKYEPQSIEKLLYSMLYILIRESNFEYLQLLLNSSYKFDCNKIVNKNNSLLYEATKVNNYNIVKLLLDNGANPHNICGILQETCLHIASRNGYNKIVKLFLDVGVSPNVQCKYFTSPLYESCIRNHIETTYTLLKYNADITIIEQYKHEFSTRINNLLENYDPDIDTFTII